MPMVTPPWPGRTSSLPSDATARFAAAGVIDAPSRMRTSLAALVRIASVATIGIEEIDQGPAGEKPAKIVEEDVYDPAVLRRNRAGRMGRDEDVVETPERAVLRQGLDRGHVEGSAGQAPIGECFDHRRLVDHRPAGDVDDDGTVTHHGDLLPPD